MAYWDGKRIVYLPDVTSPEYPHWIIRDCGCCGGRLWGYDTPITCPRCRGSGDIWVHVPTGTIALYPGGPLVGKEPRRWDASTAEKDV